MTELKVDQQDSFWITIRQEHSEVGVIDFVEGSSSLSQLGTIFRSDLGPGRDLFQKEAGRSNIHVYNLRKLRMDLMSKGWGRGGLTLPRLFGWMDSLGQLWLRSESGEALLRLLYPSQVKVKGVASSRSRVYSKFQIPLTRDFAICIFCGEFAYFLPQLLIYGTLRLEQIADHFVLLLCSPEKDNLNSVLNRRGPTSTRWSWWKKWFGWFQDQNW